MTQAAPLPNKKVKEKRMPIALVIARCMGMSAGLAPGTLAAITLLGFAMSGTLVYSTIATQGFFDAVGRAVGTGARMWSLAGPAAVMAGILIANQLVNGLVNFLFGVVFDRCIGMLGARVNEKAARLSPVEFEDTKKLELINKAQQGTSSALIVSMLPILAMTFYFLYFGLMARYLYSLKPDLALSILIIFVPVVIGGGLKMSVYAGLENVSAPRRREMEHLEKCIADRAFFKETRFLGAFSFFRGLHATSVRLLNRAAWKSQRKACLFDLIAATLTLAGYGGVLYMLIGALLAGDISAGAFAAVFGSLGMLFAIMDEALRNVVGGAAENMGAARNFVEYLRLPERQGADAELCAAEGVSLQNVSFRYPGAERDAIHDLSLTIKPGETLAIVGNNGAGKTTLTRLITGLYAPTEGAVHMGGVDLSSVSPGSLYRGISFVGQKYQKYRFDLRDNVSISEERAETADDALAKALADADLPVGSSCFPDGLDTMLSREFDGTDLSGGQWQRVAIARGFYRAHDLIVLDEPTAAIDPIEETRVFQQFSEITQGKTAILVTHRLGSARIADRVIVLEDGRIIEEGTHDELLAKNGTYAAMFAEQAQWYQR